MASDPKGFVMMDFALPTAIAGGLAFLAGEVLAHLIGRRRPNVREAVLAAIAATLTLATLASVGVNIGTWGAVTLGTMVGAVTGFSLLRARGSEAREHR